MAETLPYYEALWRYRDPAVRAGWRRRLEQAARFEAALSLAGEPARGPGRLPGALGEARVRRALPMGDPGARRRAAAKAAVSSERSERINSPVASGNDAQAEFPRTLLDLGCGAGALAGYLRDTGRELAWVGVERFEPAAKAARDAGLDVHHGDLAEGGAWAAQGYDVVVAIGALVSGRDLRSDARRMRALRTLIEAAWRSCLGTCVVVVLSQDRLESAWARDPALAGAREADLSYLAASLEGVAEREIAPVLASDLALALARPGARLGRLDGYLERVIEGPWGRETSTVEQAWLWIEAGHPERARPLLAPDRVGAGDREEARLLRAKLESSAG